MPNGKYMIDRAVQIETPYSKGSGTIYDLEKNKTDVLTAQHILSEIKKKGKYNSDEIFITLYKYYDGGIIKITPLKAKKIIDINEDLDYAIIRFEPPIKVPKAKLSKDSPKVEDEIYIAGTSVVNFPYVRKGKVINPNYLDFGAPMMAMELSITHGDSGAGIYKTNKTPEIVGMARYVLENANGDEVQYLSLSNSYDLLKEYLEGLVK